MTAVQAAVAVALRTGADEQHVLAHGRELYGQTLVHINTDLKKAGVRLVTFDSGDPSSVERVLEKHNPSIILAETIGNGPNVPVLHLASLRKNIQQYAPKSITILDNTLPLSTSLPLGEQLQVNDQILVAESATKSYTFNKELAGLVYSPNQELIDTTREYRRTTGGRPGVASSEHIQSLLPASVEEFDARNRALYKKTGELALHLYEAEKEGADFVVAHPTLTSHPAHEYTTDHYPNGATPLFFLQCLGTDDQFALATRLWRDERVREHMDIGQSFGFDRARMLPDEHGPYVRIAAGANTDTERLGEALKEAALIK